MINESVNKKGHFLGTREAARDARGESLFFGGFISILVVLGYAAYRYFEATGAFN